MDMQGLSIICAGLGVAEEDDNGNRIGYSKDESCLDNLKDLLRFLRRDDPHTREVFKQVCKWKTVSKDLIPIIQYCQNDRNLVLNAVKVLVFLTMPIEPSSKDIPQQIEYLWGLKSAITCSDTVAVIVSLLEGPLENLECESFTEDDWKLVQLVLTLFRNILAIQDISSVQKVGGSASQFLSLRDRFLELLFRENVMDLIIVITQHVGSSYSYLRQDNLLLLEISHYIFMGQNPELIAKAKDSKLFGDTKDSLDSLKSIMEDEGEKRKLARLRNMGRHSQFSGTFTRLAMDGSKAVYKGNPSLASCDILLKPNNFQRGALKKIVWDHGILPSTKDNILEVLHDFLNQFLSGGYNVLMQSICEDIEKEHSTIEKSDIVLFFQVAQFITSFQYHKFFTSKSTTEKDPSQASTEECADNTLFKGDICGPIAATMNESMFLLVISRWRNAFDGLKETHDYKFLSAAGSLMKIMIRLLDLVLELLPEDSKEPQTARILLYKLFYDQTDQGMTQFLLSLVKSFDSHKQAKSDLADLVEMIHVIVRLMENLQAHGTLRVSKKSRNSRKGKALSDKKETVNKLLKDGVTVQGQSVLSTTEQSSDLDVAQTENQVNADSDYQENNNIAVQVDESEISEWEMGNLGSNLPHIDNREIDHIDDNLSCSSDDSSVDEQPADTYEVDFKVSSFVSAFANHSLIQNLCWLLRFYKSNSIATNHYIICMLQRITDDLDLSPMLYQLSLLTTFYDILDEQKSFPCKEYANIVDFLTSLVRRMLRKMKNRPLLFVEILFWKSCRECHYINAEYLLHELGKMKKESASWGNVEANGETGWVPRSIADALGDDEADVVISHDLGYQDGGNRMENEIERVSKRKRRLVLTDDLEIRMKDLYEKFKDDENCSRLIAESLDPDGQISPAQVFNKLKQLGLKVLPKRKMHHVDKSFSNNPDQLEEKDKIMEKDSDLHNLIDLEGSLLRQSSSTRKRVRAFSKDQEEMIKALFEQFKDHKKCDYMIANALAADNSLTAAQVSRKLNQLGLRVPWKKRSKANKHLRDGELNDITVRDEQDSDNETLLSLKNRSKIKDRDTLFSDKLSKKNVEGDLSGDSDDEYLSSILKKTRKLLPEANDKKLKTVSVKSRKTDENSSNRVPEDSADKDGGSQLVGMGIEGTNEDIAYNISNKGTLEAEMIGGVGGITSGVLKLVNYGDDLPQQQMDDALADSEDDGTSGALIKSIVLRRKLRMVFDHEDDD